ncbi:battenin-like isoform X1 [Littorina saxatilis]|uniref:battenin-like isoform X1 n=1 Tax=Littorina saxatilis TaxID=31220 RepID=UPI0038B630CA
MAGPRNWVALFLMGAINNLPYVIVNSASNTLADSFGQKNLVGLVFGANVALSVFVKGLNTFFLLSVPFAVRYVVNGCLMLLGLFGVAYAFNFGFALACVVVVGSTAAFGENVSLGMLSRFPSHMINAWSSGTGMAGLLGGSIYVLFGCTVGNGQDKREKMHNLTKYAFLMTTSVVLIYWLAFFVVLRLPREEPAVDVQDDHKHPSSSVNDDTAPLLQDTLPDGSPEGSVISGKESTWLRIKRCLRLTVYLASNCTCLSTWLGVVLQRSGQRRSITWDVRNCTPPFSSAIRLRPCVQAGVFVSRSSVQLVKIRRVEVMTGLQFINMILWVADVQFKVIPVYLLPALMVCVGLLGGASYVNIFYMLLHDDRYPARDRELCINITAMYITLGIVIGTGVETALFTTLLKND